VWGIAPLLRVVTGLLRALGGLEKGAAFYARSCLFHLKMAILALEIRPMVTFTAETRRRSGAADTSRARAPADLSHAELDRAILMVFVASAMARGLR
jgi:putative membrane protein